MCCNDNDSEFDFVACVQTELQDHLSQELVVFSKLAKKLHLCQL